MRRVLSAVRFQKVSAGLLSAGLALGAFGVGSAGASAERRRSGSDRAQAPVACSAIEAKVAAANAEHGKAEAAKRDYIYPPYPDPGDLFRVWDQVLETLPAEANRWATKLDSAQTNFYYPNNGPYVDPTESQLALLRKYESKRDAALKKAAELAVPLAARGAEYLAASLDHGMRVALERSGRDARLLAAERELDALGTTAASNGCTAIVATLCQRLDAEVEEADAELQQVTKRREAYLARQDEDFFDPAEFDPGARVPSEAAQEVASWTRADAVAAAAKRGCRSPEIMCDGAAADLATARTPDEAFEAIGTLLRRRSFTPGGYPTPPRDPDLEAWNTESARRSSVLRHTTARVEACGVISADRCGTPDEALTRAEDIKTADHLVRNLELIIESQNPADRSRHQVDGQHPSFVRSLEAAQQELENARAAATVLKEAATSCRGQSEIPEPQSTTNNQPRSNAPQPQPHTTTTTYYETTTTTYCYEDPMNPGHPVCS